MEQLPKHDDLSIERFYILSEYSRDLIAFISHEGLINFVSPSHETIFGVQPEHLLGLSHTLYDKYIHPSDRMVIQNIFDRSQKDKETVTEQIRLLRKGHVWGWFDIQVSYIQDKLRLQHKFLIIMREITKHKQKEEQIKQLAFYDPLTLLPNRRLFYDRMNVMLTNAKRNKSKFAVLYLDCDRFKNINDTFGHGAGDLVLKDFAQRLLSSIREGDTVARVGGDEFIILLNHVKNELEIEQVTERIQQKMKAPWHYKDMKVNMSTSIGVAMYPKDAQDKDSLINIADRAMYEQKSKRST